MSGKAEDPGPPGVDEHDGLIFRSPHKRSKSVKFSEVHEEQHVVAGGKKVIKLGQTTNLGHNQSRRGTAATLFGTGTNATLA